MAASPDQAAKGDARKIQFAEHFQPDLDRPVCSTNINRFPLTPNQWLFPRCPVSTRGAYRDRHEREAGCGGRSSVGAQMESQGKFIL
jgi:hypothetical protein